METVNGRGSAHEADAPDVQNGAHDDEANGINKTLATVVVVAAGAALFEVALLPGLVLGVAAMAVPKYLPGFSSALAPAFKSTVRGAKDAFADARRTSIRSALGRKAGRPAPRSDFRQ